MKKIRILSAILTLVTVFTLLIPAIGVTAAPTTKVINQTVNLANISKNARGDGFEWANLTDTLTLENLNINTADEFGMKLPKNATVVLKGNNYITAASVGLVCTGQVTFEGSGTLTIVAGDVGIDMTGVRTSNLARFRSGLIIVEAGTTAIRSSAVELSFMGSSLALEITGDRTNANSVIGRDVTINGSAFAANAGIYASNSLKITSSNIDITAETPAFECPNGINITKERILSGNTADSLNSAEEYNGEKVIKMYSTSSNKRASILFGENCSIVIDYLVFIGLILAVTALIAVPIYLKKKKTEKLIAEYEASQPTKKQKAPTNQNKPSK